MPDLHKKVRAARLLRGLDQNEVAERSFINLKTYGRKERGKSPITEEELGRIAQSLGCSPDDIRQFDLERNCFPEAETAKSNETASIWAEIKSLRVLMENMMRLLPKDWKSGGGADS